MNHAINFTKRVLALVCTAAASFALCAAPAAAQQAISVGGQSQGALAQGDQTRGGGAFVDTYAFTGRAGQRVQITLNSSDFDSYLTLTGPNNFSTDNDDAPGGATLNARIDVVLPADGAYRIGASSFSSGATGRYTIGLQQNGQDQTRAQMSARISGVNGNAATNSGPRGGNALTLGQEVSGDLRRGDALIDSGEFADVYTFQGTRGQNIEVTLTSDEFDPYVIIAGPGGFQQDNDDDVESGTTNSRLVVTLPEDGQYRVQATSYAAAETGRYRLRLGQASAAMVQNAAPLAGGQGAPLRPGQGASGTLAQGDGTLQSGEFVDNYRFLGQRGQRVVIDMRSSDFDAYLMVVSPSGEQQDNDDSGLDGTNSQLEFVVDEDGEYSIHATSYQPGERGAYDIAISTPDADNRVVAEQETGAPVASDGRLQIGRSVAGRLQTGDTALRSGEFVDSWSFTGRAGDIVTFEMASAEIDSYLIVTAPSGDQSDNDDAATDVRDSRVVLRLPESGTYTIGATSYAPGESGAYTIRAISGGTPDGEVSTAGIGRVYAVMVGISDYSGLASNLPYTADDARNLAQTLRADGVLAPQSIVLTDGEATRARVRAAFQQVAAQAGPNDLFLFFYSGHGSQSDTSSAIQEPDQRNETIVLRDGEITDDEMAQMFSQVRARVALIALDSCFSGGFARDVVSRPGVMGLFSSEEDLTSAVADKFRAGGYLSHFLRTGFGGEADENGDQAITAGEISTYLWQKFATEVEAEEAHTSEGRRNYQRLVVDRGGVKVDDVVLALN